jgi:hypothetical protein
MTPLHLSHSRIPTFPHSLSPHGVKGFRRGVLDNAWRLASLSFIYTPTRSNHAIVERVNPHGYCCASLRVIGERRRVRFGALWRVRTAVSPSSLACKIKSRVKPNLQAPMHNAAPAQAGNHPVGNPCAQQGKGPCRCSVWFLRPAHPPPLPHVFHPN